MIGLSLLPTVHPSFLQQTPVRTSTKSYLRFILTMGRSLGFGSTDYNYVALLRLGFPSAPALKALTSLQPVTRRLINQKAYHHDIAAALIACRHMVSGSISLPSPGFFSPFPHGTCSLSVIRIVFSLGEWSPQLPTRFHVPRGTQDTASLLHTFRLRDYHPLRSAFPCLFDYMRKLVLTRSYNPNSIAKAGLGSSPFARRY